MMPLWGSWFFVGALIVPKLLAADSLEAVDPADAACHEVAAAAAKVPVEDQSYEIYNHCHMDRPHGGIVGESQAINDCTQLAHLYEVASHYSKNSEVSSAEFCQTVATYRKDTEDASGKKRLAANDACTLLMKKMMTSHEMQEAVTKSCERLFPGSPKEKCAKYAQGVNTASGEGEVARICGKMVRSNHETQPHGKTTHASHDAKSLEEQRFIYSCVQYASNLIAKQEGSTPEERAKTNGQVLKSCRSHVPSGDKGFCNEYAVLIEQRASRENLQTFCDAEYKRMHMGQNGASSASKAPPAAHPSPQTSTLPPVAKVQPVAVNAVMHLGMDFPGAILMNHVASNKSTASTVGTLSSRQAACEKHMDRLAKMPLPTSSKKVVIEKECHQRYQQSAHACADAAQTILVGDAMAACHSLVRMPNPSNKSAVDMVAMCEDTVANVASLDLLGEAFRQTAADMCSQGLAGSVSKLPTATSIAKSCNLFADKLASEYNQGPIDKSSFCSSWAQMAPKHALAENAKHVSAARRNTKKPSVSLIRQTQKARDSHGSDMDQDSFLDSFLDGYDAKKDGAVKADMEQQNQVSASETSSHEQQTDSSHADSDSEGLLNSIDSETPVADDPMASEEKVPSSAEIDTPELKESASQESGDDYKAADKAFLDSSETPEAVSDQGDGKEVAPPDVPPSTDDAKAAKDSSSEGDGDVDSLVSSFLSRTA